MKQVLLAALLLTVAFGVDAGFYDGNDLLRHIKRCDKYHAGQETAEHYWNCGAFGSYVLGVSDSFEILQVWEGFENYICIPDRVKVPQLKAVVRKFLEDNPADLEMPASALVLGALENTFPCEITTAGAK